MKHPIPSDQRYTITLEYTGHSSGKAQQVLRFCGEWVASSQFLSEAVMRAIGHKAERNGALVFTEIRSPNITSVSETAIKSPKTRLHR